MAGETVERRTAHGAQKHGARTQAGLQSVGGERVFVREQGRASNRFARDTELMVESFSDGFQNADGFVGNFRPDAVAGKSGEVEQSCGSIVLPEGVLPLPQS